MKVPSGRDSKRRAKPKEKGKPGQPKTKNGKKLASPKAKEKKLVVHNPKLSDSQHWWLSSFKFRRIIEGPDSPESEEAGASRVCRSDVPDARGSHGPPDTSFRACHGQGAMAGRASIEDHGR